MTRRLLLHVRGGQGGIVVRRANRAKCVLLVPPDRAMPVSPGGVKEVAIPNRVRNLQKLPQKKGASAACSVSVAVRVF